MVDIFHPLSIIHWQQAMELSVEKKLDIFYQCVFHKDKIYIAVSHMYGTFKPYLYYCSTEDHHSSWVWIPVPGTPAKSFALVTYHSQLLLIGGREINAKEVTNKVWVKDGERWVSSLPPMPTPRAESTAVNGGSSERLVVVGGLLDNDVDTAAVEVLTCKQWSSVEPVPISCFGISVTVHGSDIYVSGGSLSFSDRFLHNFLYYADLDSLLNSTAQSTGVWKKSSKRLSNESLQPAPFSFGQQLLAIGEPLIYRPHSNKIYAYSTTSESWVYVDFLPCAQISTATIELPAGELVLISRNEVFIGQMEMTSFCKENHFSMGSLSRLEEAGVHVVSALEPVCRQLASVVGLDLESLTYEIPKAKLSNKKLLLEIVIERWISGQGFHHNQRFPSWGQLLLVLKELDMEELGHQIETYLSGVRSLRDLSLSVIVSTLLQQPSPPYGQIQDLLPDYVPPTIKKSIAHLLNSRRPIQSKWW